MEQCGGGVSEDQGGEGVNVFWANTRGRQESLKLHRYESIKVKPEEQYEGLMVVSYAKFKDSKFKIYINLC